MKPQMKLFEFMGLTFYGTPLLIVGILFAWGLFAGLAIALFDIPTGEAILGGLLLAFLNEFGEIWHQVGHAIAARRTGYPMTGVKLWLTIGTSLYPKDEPELPGKTHIQRALGGPMFSLILAVIVGVIALALQPFDETPGWIGLFSFVNMLGVFVIGAMMPLGISDGSTILRYWGK